MKKLKLLALSAVALFSVTTTANAATTILATNDFVGISFWVVSMVCSHLLYSFLLKEEL